MIRCGFIMRIRPSLEILRYTGSTRFGIDFFQTLRERTSLARPLESQRLFPLQERLDGSTQLRPELNLSRDGAFRHLGRELGIENKFIGKRDWLAHSARVAGGYLSCKVAEAPRILSGNH